MNASLPSQSNSTFNHSNLTNLPANLTTCTVPNHLLIIWIFLAPHLPQCTHHAILPISRRHWEPATARCAPTDNALPSLLVWYWLLFYDALSNHAYVFLFARMHLEAGLPTQEEMHCTKTCQRNEEWQRKRRWQDKTRLLNEDWIPSGPHS